MLLHTTSPICMQCLTDLIVLLVAVESILNNPQSELLYGYLGSLSSRITQNSNSYSHVWFKIFKHLIARGYALLQEGTCPHSWLSDLTEEIVYNAWWASMNVGAKRPIASTNSRHTPSWWFYLHCGIEESSIPGIIWIICHQVLRHPSDHGTSSMGTHLLAKAHIAKLNELTESEVAELTNSMVDETYLSMLNRQGSRGITLVSSPRKIIFHIQVDPYWPKWQTKCSKLMAMDFKTAEVHQDTWNLYLMLAFVSTHILCHKISNLELWRSYKSVCDHQVLPSPATLRKIFRWQYELTLDVIKKQLPSHNKVCLANDWWTSPKKLAIMSVIGYYIDQNWALREVPLTFDDVEPLFSSRFESELKMIGQGPTHWNKASRTFEWRAWLFWAYRPPFGWCYN